MRQKRAFSILAALAALLLAVGTAFAAVSLPAPTTDFFVADYAGVLSPDTKQYIMEKSTAYHTSDGTQLVVATIPSLEGASIEQYALELARSWGVGSSEADNGLLILLAVNDREIRVEVGYGLEGVLNDAKVGRFIREATPALGQSDWDTGIRTLYDGLLGELQSPTPEDPEEEDGNGFVTILLLVLVLLLLFGRRGGPGILLLPGPFHGPFGGGGFGGGGSGGGGFRGGGGGFGGGGASGKF